MSTSPVAVLNPVLALPASFSFKNHFKYVSLAPPLLSAEFTQLPSSGTVERWLAGQGASITLTVSGDGTTTRVSVKVGAGSIVLVDSSPSPIVGSPERPLWSVSIPRCDPHKRLSEPETQE
jgi:hypothetical protein